MSDFEEAPKPDWYDVDFKLIKKWHKKPTQSIGDLDMGGIDVIDITNAVSDAVEKVLTNRLKALEKKADKRCSDFDEIKDISDHLVGFLWDVYSEISRARHWLTITEKEMEEEGDEALLKLKDPVHRIDWALDNIDSVMKRLEYVFPKECSR